MKNSFGIYKEVVTEEMLVKGYEVDSEWRNMEYWEVEALCHCYNVSYNLFDTYDDEDRRIVIITTQSLTFYFHEDGTWSIKKTLTYKEIFSKFGYEI